MMRTGYSITLFKTVEVAGGALMALVHLFLLYRHRAFSTPMLAPRADA